MTDPDAESTNARLGGVELIQGDVRTVITSAQGPVHTGEGHIFYQFYGTQARRRVRRRVGAEHIGILTARFVQPTGFQRLQERLDGPEGLALVTGQPGSGRLTAAYLALCRRVADGERLELLPVDQDDDASEAGRGEQALRDRLILDLSESDRETVRLQQDRIRRLHATSVERGGQLAIVISPEHVGLLGDDLRAAAVSIEKPSPAAVLKSHLSAHGVALSISIDQLVPSLGTMAMRHVAELADKVAEARRADPDSKVEIWMERAVAAGDSRRVDLALRDADGRFRSLTLALALLESRPVDEVFIAELKLLASVKYQESEQRLEQLGIVQRLNQLGGSPQVDVRQRVRFTELAYGTDVLMHFWRNYPDMREAFADWTCGVFESVEFDNDDDRFAAAGRLVGPATATGEMDLVLAGAERLAKEASSRQMAHDILEHALMDGRQGDVVRKRLYWWSRNQNLHVELASIGIALSANVLAPLYLSQALVRLTWFRTHTDPRIAAEAQDALLGLATDNYVRWRLLLILIERKDFDRDLFLAVAAPGDLADADGRSAWPVRRLQAQLVRGWQRIMSTATYDEMARAVVPWLSVHTRLAASGRSDLGGWLMKVLVDACEGQFDRFARLFEANRRWLADGDGELGRQQRRAAAAALETAILQSGRPAGDTLKEALG